MAADEPGDVVDEARLAASALAAAGEAVIATDTTGVVTLWNATAERLCGWTADEAVGRPVAELAVPGGYRGAVDAVVGAAVRGERRRGELVLVRKDGSSFRALVSCSPLRHDDGPPVGVVAVAVDLGGHPRSEEHYRGMVEWSADVIAVTDADLRLRYVSPSVTSVLDRDPDDLTGRDPFDLVHGDDVADLRRALAEAVGRPGPQPPALIRMSRADGEWRWIEAHATNRLDDPAVAGLVVVARDVTERVAADAALRAVVERSPVALFAFDAEGVVTLWRGAGLDAVVGRGGGGLVGRSLKSWARETGVPAVADDAARALAGDPVRDEVHLGDAVYDVQFEPVRAASGAVTGGIGVATEISQRHRAEDEARRQRERLGAVLAAAPIGVLAFDARGVVTFSEGAGLDALGIDPAASVGRSLFDVFADLPDTIERIRRVLAGEAVSLQRDIAGEDVIIWYRPERDGGGRVIGGFSVTVVVSEQRRAARRAEALADLSRAAAEAGGDARAVVQAVADRAAALLGPVASVRLVSADGASLESAAVAHTDPDVERDMRAAFATDPLPVSSTLGLVASSGTLLQVGGPEERRRWVEGAGPRYRAFLEAHPFECVLAVPLRVRGRTLGTLAVARHLGAPAYSPDDQAFLEALADRAALALDNVRLLESARASEAAAQRAAQEVRARAAQQEAVARVGELALEGPELDQLFAATVEVVGATLDVPMVYVARGQGPGHPLAVRASTGFAPGVVDAVLRPGNRSHAGYALDVGGPVVVDDYATESRFTLTLLPGAGTVASGATVPITGGRSLWGVLGVFSRTPRAFSPDEVRFLEATAHVLGAAASQQAVRDDLRHQALHDALTGLPNRVLLADRLVQALARRARAGATGTGVGVLLLDVDRFKLINDTAGHAAGDQLLVGVAERLRHHVRPGDTVARFGGDEFVVLCEDVDEPTLLRVADRLVAAFAEPLPLGDGELVVTVSVGVALADPHADRESLLRDADAAMYRAKERGRDRAELFDGAMRERARARLDTEAGLRRALRRGELALHYQPVVRLADGAVVGVEALVRWQDPVRGLVLPAGFVPVAEETGLVLELDEWALRTATAAVARWNAAGADLNVGVNLSHRDLGDPALPARVAAALADSGCEPHRLVLEITESDLAEDADAAIVCLRELRDVGVRLAIDDFGTGYSSLAHLKRFPIDTLKVDRSFVTELGAAGDDAAVTEAVIALGRALGLRVVAEGVETRAAMEALRALGCELAQGFLFSPPVPPAAIDDLLAR